MRESLLDTITFDFGCLLFGRNFKFWGLEHVRTSRLGVRMYVPFVMRGCWVYELRSRLDFFIQRAYRLFLYLPFIHSNWKINCVTFSVVWHEYSLYDGLFVAVCSVTPTRSCSARLQFRSNGGQPCLPCPGCCLASDELHVLQNCPALPKQTPSPSPPPQFCRTLSKNT